MFVVAPLTKDVNVDFWNQ